MTRLEPPGRGSEARLHGALRLVRRAAVSAVGRVLRPSVQALLADAPANAFEIVLPEALDRMNRDQADAAPLFKPSALRRGDGRYVGGKRERGASRRSEEDDERPANLAAKTWRGLRGRAEQGKSEGGLRCGYDMAMIAAASRSSPARNGAG